jgi:large subunit ribosomal protein L22
MADVVWAVLKNIRVSPRKLNLVAEQIRGKDVFSASDCLAVCPKRVAVDVRKTLRSAIANAENNNGMDISELVVKEAFVGMGGALKRSRPRAKGRGGRIRKPFSHLSIGVAPRSLLANSLKRLVDDGTNLDDAFDNSPRTSDNDELSGLSVVEETELAANNMGRKDFADDPVANFELAPENDTPLSVGVTSRPEDSGNYLAQPVGPDLVGGGGAAQDTPSENVLVNDEESDESIRDDLRITEEESNSKSSGGGFDGTSRDLASSVAEDNSADESLNKVSFSTKEVKE